MSDNEEILGIILIGCAIKLKRKRKRTIWTKKWLLNRQQCGFGSLLKELRDENLLHDDYKKYIRMDPATFDELLDIVKDYIDRKDTNLRFCITAADRLALTLRFLATGETFRSLSYAYRVSVSTISLIIPEVLKALYDGLRGTYLRLPNSQEEWLAIAQQFGSKWNFDNCIGALDGKHIVITPPTKSGSDFYNYKHSFSIVLLALVDADYKFTVVDIGTNGRISDGGVFGKSALATALEANTLQLPDDRPLPGRNRPQPFVIVADDAFPLKPNIMKPFSGKATVSNDKRIFNYRLSRARRIVENAFGILANRFRIFLTRILLHPRKVELIVLVACTLHNYLCVKSSRQFGYGLVHNEDERVETFIPGTSQQVTSNDSWHKLRHTTNTRSSIFAAEVREEFCSYFNNEGRVPWQEAMLHEY